MDTTDASGGKKTKHLHYTDTHSLDAYAKTIVCYAQITPVNSELVAVIISCLAHAVDVRGRAWKKGNVQDGLFLPLEKFLICSGFFFFFFLLPFSLPEEGPRAF